MKKVLLAFALIMITTLTTSAQEMFVASGSVGTSGKASLSYVIGGIIVDDSNSTLPILSPVVNSNVTTVTALDRAQKQLPFNVYPNPAIDNVQVDMGQSFSGLGEITIYDMSSSIVKQQSLMTSRTSINISSLNSGVYLVQVTDNNGEYSKVERLVKK